MDTNQEKAIVTAKRIKELRESKNLSHERLRQELNLKYGCDISKGSLMNYEVSEVDHCKAWSTEGMSVKNLRILSDFYGVSTDYLLGNTDIQSSDVRIQDIVSSTILTEENAKRLFECKQNAEECKKQVSELNIDPFCIEDDELCGRSLCSYVPSMFINNCIDFIFTGENGHWLETERMEMFNNFLSSAIHALGINQRIPSQELQDIFIRYAPELRAWGIGILTEEDAARYYVSNFIDEFKNYLLQSEGLEV